MEQKQIKEKDWSISYRVSGAGQPIVLSHGLGEDGEIFKHIVAGLENQFKVIVPDHVGTGKSEGNTAGISMELMADQLNFVFEAEKLSSAVLIGHSMGGYVALAFAEKYPEKLSKLGLFHSSGFADTEEKKATRLKNIAFIEKHGAAKFIEQANPKLFSEKTRTENPALVKEIVTIYSKLKASSLIDYNKAMLNRRERLDVLKNFPNPVLFLLGEFDTAVPIEQGLKQVQIPGISYIYICTNSGHLGMIEEPEFCVKSILDFLSR